MQCMQPNSMGTRSVMSKEGNPLVRDTLRVPCCVVGVLALSFRGCIHGVLPFSTLFSFCLGIWDVCVQPCGDSMCSYSGSILSPFTGDRTWGVVFQCLNGVCGNPVGERGCSLFKDGRCLTQH
jgi:hypothetical protein